MKKIIAVAAFMILVISGLTIYVSAQYVSPQGTFHGVITRPAPSTKEIVLLQALNIEERYQEGVQVISQPANGAALTNGTLKIFMTDGSFQEIPLLKVKKLMIETR